MGLNPLEINRLGTCALLHDIGKIGINDELLNKKEPLTPEEWELIKSHPKMGAAIVGHSSQLAPCVQGILHHHERYDGTGYPDGLKGEEIPLESRILAIADSFCRHDFGSYILGDAYLEKPQLKRLRTEPERSMILNWSIFF